MELQMTDCPLNTELIQQQEVYCSHKSRGCRKVMALSELQAHLKTCLYGLMHCPLKCGQAITIKSLPEHMAGLCPRRGVNCQYCEEEIPLDTKEEHEKCCPKRPSNNRSVAGRLVEIVKNLNIENAELTGRVNELTERVEALETINKSLNEREKTLEAINKSLTERVEALEVTNKSLNEREEALEATNKLLTEQMSKLETIKKADIASMRTLIEVLRKEFEEFKTNISKQIEDEESEV